MAFRRVGLFAGGLFAGGLFAGALFGPRDVQDQTQLAAGHVVRPLPPYMPPIPLIRPSQVEDDEAFLLSALL